MPVWFVYMVRTAQGQLYTGISTDPLRRLRQHQGLLTGGAKALRGKGPLSLVYQTPYPDRASASKAEYQLKQLGKTTKEQLVQQYAQQYSEYNTTQHSPELSSEL